MNKFQWGNRKRPRCAKLKSSSLDGKSGGVKKKFTARAVEKIQSNHAEFTSTDGNPRPSLPSPRRPNREMGSSGSTANDNLRPSASSSLEKEDKYYTTRGCSGFEDGGNKAFANPMEDIRTEIVWPRLLITLSNKEKVEDFMAIKGCKPPQRPKKRAKLIQRTILLVSPGAWLTDLCQERYEVREKKSSKKKPGGLKAMGSMESDSEW